MKNKNPYQQRMIAIAGTRPVAFNPALGKILGSVKAGLFLSQLLYWWGKGRNPNWIYKTITEIENEIGLSRKEQETAIKKCVNSGFLVYKLMGIPAKRHF